MNYKITFQLSTPLSIMTPPTFDGVLSYAYARETLGESFEQRLSLPKDEIIDFSPMPITMHPKGYFMASQMQWDKDNMVEFQEKWRKRWDARHDHLVDKAVKIRIQQGKFKSYDVPYPLKDIKTLWFYFQSDNVQEVERLVSKWIMFLGKKRAYGQGLVESFGIEQDDTFDYSGVFRPMPKEAIDIQELTKQPNFKFGFAYCGWRPPYWLPNNITECLIFAI
jgi:CRISPR type IV-associated protein Csf3